MQLHQNASSRAALEWADALDGFTAGASRAFLHAQAAAARFLHGQPPIEFVAGPAHPSEVVDEGPLARVRHYRASGPASGSRLKTPILIVSSLINRYYVLDLLPDVSLISALCGRGFDVYVLDWKAPGGEGPHRRFADYLDGAIASAARIAAERSGTPSVAVLGYCMGGTLAAMYAARHPASVRALALLGTPIDFHASGVLAEWTRPEYFDADLVVDAFGNMPPALLQSGFKLMNPVDAIAKTVHLFEMGGDEPQLRRMVALQAWLDDNFAFPGGIYREYIRELYQKNALVAGNFKVAGEPVRLERIAAPLLNVIALRDHICAPPSSRALMDRVSSTDKRVLEFDTGHIGLTTSARSQAGLWPQILDWLAERS